MSNQLKPISYYLQHQDEARRLPPSQLAIIVAGMRKMAEAVGIRTNLFQVPDNPADFAEKLSGGKWWKAKHLEVISHKIKEAAEGKNPRILISTPPRHGKSELTSVWTPLWLLAKNPETKIILASYEADFAAQWGRRVRNAIIEYGPELGLKLSDDSSSASRWHLTTGGGMTSTGIGGALMGRGANCLLIDDYLKNSEEAASEVIREKMWDWFQTSAYSRLEPGGFAIIIATRWHSDDLIGRLEAASISGEGLPFDIIKFPAMAEANDPLGREIDEPLWPERYPKQALLDLKKLNSPYNWSCIYQQSPSPEEGGGVKRAWWKFYKQAPAQFDQVIQSWDLAFKDLKTSDYVVGQVWGRLGGEFYLLHQVRDRMDSPSTIQAIRAMTSMYPKALAKLIEDKANGPAIIAMLNREVSGIIPWPPKGIRMASKDARLSSVVPLIQAGNVYLPENLDGSKPNWVWEFIEEHAAFPNGTNDDQVDSAVQALSYLQPQSWTALNRAHREAKANPPATSPKEMLQMQFSKSLKKSMKNIDKKMNSMDRPKRARHDW